MSRNTSNCSLVNPASAILALCLSGFAHHAAAIAYVEADPLFLGGTVLTATGPTHAQLSQGGANQFESATLSADSTLGALHSNVSSPVFVSAGFPNYQAFSIGSKVLINDSVAFQNYLPGETATLYFALHGTLTNNLPTAGIGQFNTAAYGTFNVQAYNTTNNELYRFGFGTDANVGSSSVGCFLVNQCVVGTAPIDIYGSLSIPITANPYTFEAYLKLTATGFTADFSNTALLYLSLPAGVTYTSGSGSFLTGATPIAPVPEPSSLLLMIAGLAALVMVRRPAFRLRRS